VELGDFDGDGLLDLMVASGEGSEHVELFLGDGGGGFEESESSPFSIAPGGKKIAVGDFNGDGIADAVVASYQSSKVLVLLGGRDSIRNGYLPGGEHPWGLVATDLNEDGNDDLIVADDANPRAAVYLSLDPTSRHGREVEPGGSGRRAGRSARPLAGTIRPSPGLSGQRGV
jgi:hypothetical protein